MRITSKGRITIPAAIRKRAGLLPDTEVFVEFDGVAVLIVPVTGRGERLIAHLRGHGDADMSTGEIMELVRGE
jgi:AbrB family looped-hinge helix DNA binding protein